MFYPRTILPQLENELKTEQVVVITGMRQVGKTTLLKNLFGQIGSDNKAFLDFENPLHRKVFEEEDYENIWNNLQEFNINKEGKAFIFIDEIQNLPKASSAIKYLYDHWKVKFFLTGSSSFYLKNLFPESLAGRKLIYEVYPLTFAEFLTFKKVRREKILDFKEKAEQKNKIRYEKLSKFFLEYVQYGGFPRVVLEMKRERKNQILEEIFKSYFEQDVKTLADFKNLSRLRDLILLLIPRVGSKLDISKLANDLDVSRETVYSYLSFLEKTYFIQLLAQFSKSIDRQAAGSKKVYLCDSGLANLLGQPSEGQQLENSVFQALRPHHKFNYYQKNSKEIDFIVDDKIGLEVKKSVSARDIQNLQKRSERLSLEEKYIISQNWSGREEVILAVDL